VIVLVDQNFPGLLPSAKNKCLAIVRLERGKLDELGDFLSGIFHRDRIPKGTIVLLGSLTHLMLENLSGYATSCVGVSKKLEGFYRKKITVIPFVPPPMGEVCNPQFVSDILDACQWFGNLAKYPLSKTMLNLGVTVLSEGGGEGVPVRSHSDKFVSLPQTLDDHIGHYVLCPGRQDLPMSIQGLSQVKERKFLSDLLTEVNLELLAGLDSDPNLSRDTKKPALFCALRNGEVETCITLGGSHARNLTAAVTSLGLDTYSSTEGGWKISNDSIEAAIPALKEKIAAAPKGTPVVLFCLDNSTYFCSAADGSMTPPVKSTDSANKYHIVGDLVIAPDRWVTMTIEKLNRLTAICTENPCFVLSPMPRYVVSPCCKDKAHVTNYDDADYLSVLMKELARFNNIVRSTLVNARLVDTMELICGGKTTMEKVEQVILSGWPKDPVHPNNHTYAKIALHLLEKLAEPSPGEPSGSLNRGTKRKREESAEARSSKVTSRSSRWREWNQPQNAPWKYSWKRADAHGDRYADQHERGGGGNRPRRGGGYGRLHGRGRARGHY